MNVGRLFRAGVDDLESSSDRTTYSSLCKRLAARDARRIPSDDDTASAKAAVSHISRSSRNLWEWQNYGRLTLGFRCSLTVMFSYLLIHLPKP